MLQIVHGETRGVVEKGEEGREEGGAGTGHPGETWISRRTKSAFSFNKDTGTLKTWP